MNFTRPRFFFRYVVGAMSASRDLFIVGIIYSIFYIFASEKFLLVESVYYASIFTYATKLADNLVIIIYYQRI